MNHKNNMDHKYRVILRTTGDTKDYRGILRITWRDTKENRGILRTTEG